MILLVGSLLLYAFWDKASHSIWKDAAEIVGLMLAVVDLYILMNILSVSIKIVDNSMSGKIFAQHNSENMWVIFRRIVYFFRGLLIPCSVWDWFILLLCFSG